MAPVPTGDSGVTLKARLRLHTRRLGAVGSQGFFYLKDSVTVTVSRETVFGRIVDTSTGD
jgi:hypothetical protein